MSVDVSVFCYLASAMFGIQWFGGCLIDACVVDVCVVCGFILNV